MLYVFLLNNVTSLLNSLGLFLCFAFPSLLCISVSSTCLTTFRGKLPYPCSHWLSPSLPSHLLDELDPCTYCGLCFIHLLVCFWERVSHIPGGWWACLSLPIPPGLSLFRFHSPHSLPHSISPLPLLWPSNYMKTIYRFFFIAVTILITITKYTVFKKQI